MVVEEDRERISRFLLLLRFFIISLNLTLIGPSPTIQRTIHPTSFIIHLLPLICQIHSFLSTINQANPQVYFYWDNLIDISWQVLPLSRQPLPQLPLPPHQSFTQWYQISLVVIRLPSTNTSQIPQNMRNSRGYYRSLSKVHLRL